ncbi:MAG: hypothetical protein AVDCRST_MAG10-3393, partial [uncultured Acidimicrobiales bacterium]
GHHREVGACCRREQVHLQRRPVQGHRPRLAVRGLHRVRCARGAGGGTRVGGPARPLVDDQRPGDHRLLRRLGHRRRGRALPHGQGPKDHRAAAAVGPPHMDGVEGDRRVRRPARDVHRSRRHIPEGRSRRHAQARHGSRHPAPLPHLHQHVPRQRERLLRQLRPAEDRLVRQHGEEHHAVEELAGHPWTDPRRPQGRRLLARRRRHRRQHRQLPARHGEGRPRGRPRRVQARRPVHRPQQLGHRLGRQGLRLRQPGVHRRRLLQRVLRRHPL